MGLIPGARTMKLQNDHIGDSLTRNKTNELGKIRDLMLKGTLISTLKSRAEADIARVTGPYVPATTSVGAAGQGELLGELLAEAWQVRQDA